MNFRSCLILNLVLCCLFPTSYAHAQDASDGTLHVLRPIIHAEQDKAELCLEFDHALAADSPIQSGVVKLESGLKNIPVTSKNLSVNGSELCIPSLDHRKDYRLILSNLHGAAGEKLSVAYSLSFTVPARHPVLVFVNNASRSGMSRWQDNDPVLRAVNVPYVKLELFRISDSARMAEAWSQRMQTTLAPSESATYARTNGTSVWQSELTLDDAADKNTEAKVPLAEQVGDASPGLYLMVASAPELREEQSYLIPTAAAWLLRSTIRISAQQTTNGVYALAEKADGSAVLKDVQVKILNHAQQSIVEGKTGDDGVVFLAVPNDKRSDALVLTGSVDGGNSDFFDLTQDKGGYAVSGNEAGINLTKSFYAPGSVVEVNLTAHDLHNHPIVSKDGSLQILRPDRSMYAAYPVTADVSGHAQLSFAAPLFNGVWPLVWRQGDGQQLTEAKLRVTTNPDAPRLEMSLDRELLSPDGEANVTLKSLTDLDVPAPFIAGRIEAAWNATDHIFSGWDDYRFGTGAGNGKPAAPEAFFVTDDKGTAHIHLKLTPPDDGSPLHAVVLTVVSDPSVGAADPAAVTLPIKPRNTIVGIRPLALNGRFTENSFARFDVVALDSDGHRRSMDDLAYRIYEQGRSFDWYQSEGSWDYKPLQQQRRIGGGSFSLSADSSKRIEWPVTAGAYRLEIVDSNGSVIARMDFSAGWGIAKPEEAAPAGLALKPSSDILHAGKNTDVHFALEKPALITALIADDHIRSVIHTMKPAGDASVGFVPGADWGRQVGVWVSAEYQGSADPDEQASGHVTLSFGQAPQMVSASMAQLKLKKTTLVNASPKASDNLVGDDVTLHNTNEETLAPQRQWTVPTDKTHTKAGSSAVYVAAEPLYELPALLADAIERHPFTTSEIAAELNILRMWHEVIVASGLLTEAALRGRQIEWTTRLLGRQQSDGGFSSLPNGVSDFVATSDALMALSETQQTAASPAVNQAVDWLRHRLENTWFDERERPLRAAAYAALAAANKLDASSLHYFSDTSSDKVLPPLADAQLASAFAKLNDRDKTTYWLSVMHIAKNAPATPLEIMPYVTANLFFDPHDGAAALAKFSAEALKKPQDFLSLSQFLLGLGHLQDRTGKWTANINKVDRTVGGVQAFYWSDKIAPPLLRNLSEHPLHVQVAHYASQAASRNTMTRRILRLDGAEAGNDLQMGETYIVTLDGAWPAGEKTAVFVHDDVGPALRPIGCLPKAPDNDFLSWLRSSALVAPLACEQADGSTDSTIEHDGSGSMWRIAYLVKTDEVGSFELDAPLARASTGSPDFLKGPKTRIQVK